MYVSGSGVAASLQKLEPPAVFVHCLAHSNNLCVAGYQLVNMKQWSWSWRFSPKAKMTSSGPTASLSNLYLE